MTRKSVFVATALAIVALFGRDASAQVPGLTATAVGRTVTINITPVAGSSGHRLAVGTAPGAANIATVNLPLSVTHIVVDAPEGVYYMRAAATLGSIVGAFSPEVRVDVASAAPPPGPCTAPVAPTVTATASSLSVSISWTPVAGAIGYQVHYSRVPGGTELVENTASTSVSKFVGIVGTFFVRVVAVTPCGSATSTEVTFTLANTPGAGPRTPDPPAGQLLPMPSYAGDVVRDVARRFPGDLARHSGPNCKNENTWLFRLLYELRLRDSRWGLNWKRGWAGTFSTDIITYNPTAGPDATATHIYLADILGAECEGNHAKFDWEEVTQTTWNADRLNPGLCANRDCAAWTILPYLQAGFPAITQ